MYSISLRQLDDGFPPTATDNGMNAAPMMAEGESQELTEYPAPEAIKTEEGVNGENEWQVQYIVWLSLKTKFWWLDSNPLWSIFADTCIVITDQ